MKLLCERKKKKTVLAFVCAILCLYLFIYFCLLFSSFFFLILAVKGT